MGIDDLAGNLTAITDRGRHLVATTAEETGAKQEEPLSKFLGRIREAFGVDVVFVSQFVDGKRVVRAVDCDPDDEHGLPEGACDPLEESYCFHVVQGRLPQVIPDTRDFELAMNIAGTHTARVGSHLSVPIIGHDGGAFGTVCCFSHHPDGSIGSQVQMEILRSVAALLSDTFGPDRRQGPTKDA
jgi:GAF domain-containing protein